MVHLFSPNSGQRLSRSDAPDSSYRLIARLVTGLVQGALLYGLYRATQFKGDLTGVLAAWGLVAGYAPPVVLAAIGQLRLKTTLIWAAITSVLLIALGLSSDLLPDTGGQFVTMALCLPAALFCAHHLVIPALRAERAFAPYDDYYETAWKSGIQLVLALMFLGVFWLILFLGSALFNAIGIGLVEDLIQKPAFILFASPLLFALGVELTDVRDGLTQGIRIVALSLLSWLLPIAVLLAGAFVIALPLTGLSDLQTSFSPSALMLSASAGLIVLINTAYQDGRDYLTGSAFLRITLRIGCLLLLPMTAIALWAMSVRIGEYGLTVPRIVAVTAAVIGLIYAIGYVLAQLPLRRQSEGWLPALEGTNTFAGVVITLVLIGFSTPWLNPQQLTFKSQFARIDSGQLTAEQIPFNWLAYSAGERGQDTLKTLSQSDDPKIASKASELLTNRNPEAYPFKLTFLPEGTATPEGFETMLQGRPLSGQCKQVNGCFARMYDIDADGKPEVLLAAFNSIFVYQRDSEGVWSEIGTFGLAPGCSGDLPKELLNQNAPVASRKPRPQPIELGGHVLDFASSKGCEP